MTSMIEQDEKEVAWGAVPMIAVDRKGEKPLHRQIYDAFRAMILERRLQPGQQIPSTRALADELGFREFPFSAPTLNSSPKVHRKPFRRGDVCDEFASDQFSARVPQWRVL